MNSVDSFPPVPRIIELQRHLDPRGNLAVIEGCGQVPFGIERCHWIYDVPGGGAREGHAYRRNQEFIIALSGSFDVMVTLGSGEKQCFSLNRSYRGLLLPALTWRELDNFSTNAVVLVLSSHPYDPSDYITDLNEFLRNAEKNR